MDTVQVAEIPSEEQYLEVERAVQEAHDAVERLVRGVWGLALPERDGDHLKLGRRVTRDDVAMLYSFREGLKGKIREAKNHEDMLGQVLVYVDTARREGYVAGGDEASR